MLVCVVRCNQTNNCYSNTTGACSYTLTREVNGRFDITAENLPCGTSGVTCTKSVTVQVTALRMIHFNIVYDILIFLLHSVTVITLV